MKTLIGIPTLNGPERLERCLASIKRYTAFSDDLVLLVSDDFSTPVNTERNKQICEDQNVEMLMAPKRYGIATQWNRLVHHVPDAEVIVLVNDDIQIINSHWLDVLQFSVMRNPHAGMVGLRSVQWSPGQGAAGGYDYESSDYTEAQLYSGQGTLVSSGGACFAFCRSTFEEVNGFDERYLCFYEEVDFGVNLALNHGYFHYFASYPILLHEVGATIATNYDARLLLEESLEKFTKKWGTWTLDDIRVELGRRQMPKTFEWNSQQHNWRRP